MKQNTLLLTSVLFVAPFTSDGSELSLFNQYASDFNMRLGLGAMKADGKNNPLAKGDLEGHQLGLSFKTIGQIYVSMDYSLYEEDRSSINFVTTSIESTAIQLGKSFELGYWNFSMSVGYVELEQAGSFPILDAEAKDKLYYAEPLNKQNGVVIGGTVDYLLSDKITAGLFMEYNESYVGFAEDYKDTIGASVSYNITNNWSTNLNISNNKIYDATKLNIVYNF